MFRAQLARIFKGPAEPPVTLRSGPFTSVQVLKRSEGWRSDDGRTVLILDSRGRLTLSLDGAKVWSPPVTRPIKKVILDGEGRLSAFAEDSERLWTQGERGKRSVDLRLQEDGNMVLYSGSDVLWFSGTRHSETVAAGSAAG